MKYVTSLALLLTTWSAASADPLNCSLSAYKAQPGLTATTTADGVTLAWEGERGQEVRLAFSLVAGTPTIKELAVRARGGQWGVVASGTSSVFGAPPKRYSCQLFAMSRQTTRAPGATGIPLRPPSYL